MLHFTVEEINLIAMYKADTLTATLTAIDEALPDMYDEDIISITESATRKLSALTEEKFSTILFTPDGDMDEYE